MCESVPSHFRLQQRFFTNDVATSQFSSATLAVHSQVPHMAFESLYQAVLLFATLGLTSSPGEKLTLTTNRIHCLAPPRPSRHRPPSFDFSAFLFAGAKLVGLVYKVSLLQEHGYPFECR